MTKLHVLKKGIEYKRKEMVASGLANGFTNHMTLKHSHELDKLILEYQKRINTDKKP
ncbi:aspartyl-phosphate phosphatase Spo0E family protein [Salipaludibacillus agaradhaerens]|jgi:hypothetical protein|uniref:aspartyl-phosphate phosphatase Spo0E family protein n=1 Tax=Salipaludibacillus agaradhaerens TaxID=76935 RepID=UPI000996118C|nr:aspartyl-phosphate phosphatase Spo0E family protein [Salipaludibacillus agaradhaerens]